MIVRIPFILIHHLVLVFFMTSQKVSSHPRPYEPEGESVEDFESEYYHECPNNYERVIVQDRPRVEDVPQPEPDDYYYVDEPVYQDYPPPRKSNRVMQDVNPPAYYEEVVVNPSRPTFKAPVHVFDDSDMC